MNDADDCLSIEEIRTLKKVAKLHDTSRFMTGVISTLAIIGAFVLAVFDHLKH